MRRGREGEPKAYRALIEDGRCRVLGADGQEIAHLAPGEWSDWRREGFVIDGQPVEGHLRFKLISLTDGSASGVGPVMTGGVVTVGPSPGACGLSRAVPTDSVSKGLEAQPTRTRPHR